MTVTRDDAECCGGRIRFRDQLVELASTGLIYASLEGVYKVKEGDLVVMSFPSGARRFPPRYYVLLYRVPEIVTRGRFPDGGESDSTWRTQEARHVGSDTIAPGF